MNWFLISSIAPLLYALTNHIDKLLLDKYFKNRGVGVLLIFSSIVGIFVLPFLLLIYPKVLDMPFQYVIILLSSGIISAIVLFLYFEALKEEEASIVVIFYQLIPVFAYILGIFILDEFLNKTQILSSILIILGASIISFEIDTENKFKLKKRTLYLMTAGSLLSALDSVMFKYVAIKENLWQSLFWENVGIGLFGLVIYIFIKKYRNDFIISIKTNSKKIFSFNVLNELLSIGGNFIFAYAFLLAPISLVLLVNSYQPIMVFIIGIILTLFFPKISTEKIHLKNIVQKVLSLSIIAIGTYFLLV